MSAFKKIYRILKETRPKSVLRVLAFNSEPIFIVGCGRSGTTILQAILGAHPQIFAIPKETKIYLRNKRRAAKFLNSIYFKAKFFITLIKQNIPKGKKRWCEKTPRHIHSINEIFEDFNNKVKIINIVRDCRDVVLSTHPIYGDNYVSVERWIKDVEEGKKWESHKCVYTIKYEDLVFSTEIEIKKLLLFLGADDINLMDFEKKTNVIEHSAWEGKVKSLNTESVGKWKSHKNDLIDEIMSNQEVINLLKHYKYI